MYFLATHPDDGSLGVQHLQNVHPLFVHFPIAFLVRAALIYVPAWISPRTSPALTA
jgi:uncharacterized membrane protein